MALRGLPLALAVAAVGVACGSRTALLVPEGTPACAASAPAVAATTCPPYDAGAASFQSTATGSITGPGLDVSFCPGLSVYLEAPHVPGDTSPYYFVVATDTSGSGPPFVVRSPTGIGGPLLQGFVGLPFNDTGEYDSSQEPPDAIALVSFTYDLPVDPCLTCGTGVPASPADCPAGCSTLCSSQGCLPCRPNPPAVSYAAIAWHVRFTSVVPDGANGTIDDYQINGTFTATLSLVDTSGMPGPGVYTLAMTF